MAASGEHRRVFASFDQDGDGKISAAKLRLCMRATLGGDHDISAEDVQALMASADTDGDGLLDEEEFAMLVQEPEPGQEEGDRCRLLRLAFGMYEVEGGGCITPLSLKLMLSKLGLHLDAEDCRDMICRFDLD